MLPYSWEIYMLQVASGILGCFRCFGFKYRLKKKKCCTINKWLVACYNVSHWQMGQSSVFCYFFVFTNPEFSISKIEKYFETHFFLFFLLLPSKISKFDEDFLKISMRNLMKKSNPGSWFSEPGFIRVRTRKKKLVSPNDFSLSPKKF